MPHHGEAATGIEQHSKHWLIQGDEEADRVRVWRDLDDVDAGFGPVVVTIGNFDGVHLGHRHVLKRTRDVAGDLGDLPVVAVTFDPHPMSVIRPDKAPRQLTSLESRLELLDSAGVDAVLVLRFDAELADLPAEDFVTDILLGGLHAQGIVVGENFRFGHRALGDIDLLSKMGAPYGVSVVSLPLDGSGDQTWSSTYIRERVAEGDVASAATALGRPFATRGVVVKGEQRGRELGFPTANVPVSSDEVAVPADGVYAGWLRRLDVTAALSWPAAISVGTNPTFEGTDRHVESYVLDRDDLELYGARVEVLFVAHLRGMVRFDSGDALIEQMVDDVDRARALLGAPLPEAPQP
ncbi:MAG: bifunctional riboflavin kinase/FAD synthetase [Nocardioidaceae bacterium]